MTVRQRGRRRRASVPSLPMFLRIGAVMRLTGRGRSTIYRMMAEQRFLNHLCGCPGGSSRGVGQT